MQPALTATDETRETKTSLPPRRKRVPLGVIAAAIAILGAVAYLVFANTQASAMYYMTVPELKHCTICATQSVRVAGVVQAGSIVRDDQQGSISFMISDSNQSLPVTYNGVVPDIFRAGAQVVVEGRYSGQGAFHADTLLTKCPSKFQSATPTSQQ